MRERIVVVGVVDTIHHSTTEQGPKIDHGS